MLATLGEDIALIQREFLTRLQARVAEAPTGLSVVSLADPVYLVTAANALVTNDEARALAAYSAVLQDVLLEAFAEAGSAFNSVFDPSLEVRGGLQPVVLGVPFGEPTEEAVLRIDRNGVTLGMKGSLSKMFLSIGGGVGVAAGELVTRIGLADTFEMTGQLPLTAVVDGLLTGGPLAIDPFDLDWSVELVQATTVAGFEIATMTGVLLPPNNQSYLDARVWKAWQPGGPSSGNLIPVNTQAHYDSLLAHGGLLLTTQLRAPELLTDPAAVFERASLTPPDDVLDYVPWLQNNIEALTELTEVGSYQVYFPSVLELLPAAERGRVWRAPQDALEIIDDAYGEAFWDVDVLGLDIGRGLVSIDGVDPVEVVLSADLELIDRQVDLQLGGATIESASGPPVALPAFGFDVQLTPADVTEFLGQVGVPIELRVSGPSARLRGYSPGFDLAGDELQIRGGVEASVTLSAQPLFGAAEFELRVMPSGGSRVDVIGTATVPTMNLAPGIVVTDALVTLEVTDGVASFRIAGGATSPLGTATVDATLAPDFTGPVALTMTGPPQATGGFTITAGLVVTLARDPGWRSFRHCGCWRNGDVPGLAAHGRRREFCDVHGHRDGGRIRSDTRGVRIADLRADADVGNREASAGRVDGDRRGHWCDHRDQHVGGREWNDHRRRGRRDVGPDRRTRHERDESRSGVGLAGDRRGCRCRWRVHTRRRQRRARPGRRR